MLRERLETAIESGTKHTLKEALDDFILHNVPDRGEVKKAKDKLGFFDDRKGNLLGIQFLQSIPSV